MTSSSPARRLRVAVGQFSAGADPVANLAALGPLVAGAADAGARLVVFPEAAMACFGSRLASVAEPLDGPYATGVRELARRHDVTIAVGMFTPAEDGRVHNTLLLTGPDVETTYRKVHLFDAFGARESDTVAPGDDLVVVEVAGARVGLAICYDLRFADQFTALGRAGAEVVVVPASWGDGPGKAEQWDLLARARASDAQAWLVAADQAWTEPRGATPLGLGRSAVVDPFGTVRARLGAEPGLLVSELDLDRVAEVRARVPVVSTTVRSDALPRRST